MVFNGRWKVAGQNFGTVMKQRCGSSCIRITFYSEHFLPNKAECVRQDCDHVAVLLNVFRERIAHQAPAINISHSGNIGKEVLVRIIHPDFC